MRKRRRIPTIEGLEFRRLMSLLSQVPILDGKVHGSAVVATATTLGPRGALAVSEGTK